MEPIKVKDVYQAAGTAAVVVEESCCLEQILQRFSHEAELRSIFVTDASGRLTGVITRRDLLYWTRLRLGVALKGLTTTDSILRLAQLVRADTAKDIIRAGGEKVSVHPDDPLEQALQLMLYADIIALPVVDEEGKILGDLTLSDLLRHLLEPEEKQGD